MFQSLYHMALTSEQYTRLLDGKTAVGPTDTSKRHKKYRTLNISKAFGSLRLSPALVHACYLKGEPSPSRGLP